MRKLEGIVKEIVDEMEYLKSREERFQLTNGASGPHAHPYANAAHAHLAFGSVHAIAREELRVVHDSFSDRARCLADIPPPRVFQAEVSHRLEQSIAIRGLSLHAFRFICPWLSYARRAERRFSMLAS